jgi:hypothetical protein
MVEGRVTRISFTSLLLDPNCLHHNQFQRLAREAQNGIDATLSKTLLTEKVPSAKAQSSM